MTFYFSCQLSHLSRLHKRHHLLHVLLEVVNLAQLGSNDVILRKLATVILKNKIISFHETTKKNNNLLDTSA